MLLSREELWKEVQVRTSRSSGSGGQNVNKVSSRVELIWEPASSRVLDEAQKELFLQKQVNRITQSGQLIVACEEERSQLLNKRKAFEKLLSLIERSLLVQKPRKASKPSKAAIQKRLQEKAHRSEQKANRSKNFE